MYDVGKLFHQTAQGVNRQVALRATFNDTVIVGGDYIKSVTIKNVINGGETLTIGNTCSSYITLDMKVPDELTVSNIKSAKIFIEMGFLSVTDKINAIDLQLYVDSLLGYLYQNSESNAISFSLSGNRLTAEHEDSDLRFFLDDGKVCVEDARENVADFTCWLPMGVFYTKEAVSKDDYKNVTITAYDGMTLIEAIEGNYKLKSPYTFGEGTAGDHIKRIAENAGVECVIPNGLPNEDVLIPRHAFYSASNKTILGYMAGFMGCNAIFDRLGRLTVKPYKKADYLIDRRQQYLGGLEKLRDDTLRIASMKCNSPEGAGSTSTIGGFKLGYINDSGELVKNVMPAGKVGFYSEQVGVIPGMEYTFKRNDVQGTVSVHGYTAKGGYIGELDDVISRTKLLPSGEDTMVFTVTNSDVRYLRFTTVNPRYTTYTSPNGNVYYYLDNNITLTRKLTGDGTITCGDGFGIEFENPYFFYQSQLEAVFALYKDLEYLPCTVKYRGNPALDTGDIITAEDRTGNEVNIIITSQDMKISGGFGVTLKSAGSDNDKSSISYASSGTGSVQNSTTLIRTLEKNQRDILTRLERLEEFINSAN